MKCLIDAIGARIGWLLIGARVVAFLVSAISFVVFIARREAALGAGWVAGSMMWFRK
ncbi:MAG: hypothetical protein KGJ80_14240 [Chloroflexota bacterium]|nr:hypothetical protein [Chloroflexota bacterium]